MATQDEKGIVSIVDADGHPIARKATVRERLGGVTLRTKALVASSLAVLAVVAGAITNIDKVTGVFTPHTKNVTAESDDGTHSQSLETIRKDNAKSAIQNAPDIDL